MFEVFRPLNLQYFVSVRFYAPYFERLFTAGKTNIQEFSFKPESFFGYFLHYVTISYPVAYKNGATTTLLKPLQIEFLDNLQRQQNSPIPTSLISTPNQDNYEEGDPWLLVNIAGTPTPQLTAQGLRSHKMLNYFYPFGMPVQIRVTRDSAESRTLPHYVMLLLHGYLVPEKQSGVFG
jgi:hypothetical protein